MTTSDVDLSLPYVRMSMSMSRGAVSIISHLSPAAAAAPRNSHADACASNGARSIHSRGVTHSHRSRPQVHITSLWISRARVLKPQVEAAPEPARHIRVSLLVASLPVASRQSRARRQPHARRICTQSARAAAQPNLP